MIGGILQRVLCSRRHGYIYSRCPAGKRNAADTVFHPCGHPAPQLNSHAPLILCSVVEDKVPRHRPLAHDAFGTGCRQNAPSTVLHKIIETGQLRPTRNAKGRMRWERLYVFALEMKSDKRRGGKRDTFISFFLWRRFYSSV